MKDYKCNRLTCLWFLYSFDFSPYAGQNHWERVKIEREYCPKDCKKYIESEKIKADVKKLLNK